MDSDDIAVRIRLVWQTVQDLRKSSGGNPTREEVSTSLRRNYPSIEDESLMHENSQKWISQSIEYALCYGLVEEFSGRISTSLVVPEIINCLRAQPSEYLDINRISKYLQEHGPPEISELCKPSNIFNICYKCRYKFRIYKDDKALSERCYRGTSNDMGAVRIKLRGT